MRWSSLLRKVFNSSTCNMEHGEEQITSGMKKLVRRKAVNKATCDHYEHPIWMLVLGNTYQARCEG